MTSARLVQIAAACAGLALGQTPGQVVTLADAVSQAETTYPSIAISRTQIEAAAAGIRLARAAYLPRVDGVVQLNRGTHNNVFGPTLPQGVLSPISGPVVDNTFRNAWGSSVGVLVAWEPFDFGRRKAGVDAASASQRHAEASAARTQYDVGVLTADAYLTILAADQTVKAASAAVARAEALVKSARALTGAQLRPGADLERATAEEAAAITQSIQAEQAAANARVTLGALLGMPPGQIAVDGAPFFRDGSGGGSVGDSSGHPALVEQQSAAAEAKARASQLDFAYFPKIELMANLYARGSGARLDGTTGGALAGFGPNIANWVAGFQVTLPILDLPAIRARREVERRRAQGESLRLNLVRREVDSQLERARISLTAAERIAKQTPIQMESARRAETQMAARYQAGLGTITEMADAERTVAQAEIDDSLARLNVWRARLAIAAAQGDLKPFLDATKSGSPGQKP